MLSWDELLYMDQDHSSGTLPSARDECLLPPQYVVLVWCHAGTVPGPPREGRYMHMDMDIVRFNELMTSTQHCTNPHRSTSFLQSTICAGGGPTSGA